MAHSHKKFSIRVKLEILSELRLLAEREGLPLQALVNEALSDLINKYKSDKPRPHVMRAFIASHERYALLYKKLAE